MKKFFSFAVIAAMCVSMVGCGGDAKKPEEKKPDAPAPSAPADPAAKPADAPKAP